MTEHIGAPGSRVSRREFVAATSGLSAAALAGCTAAFEADGVPESTTAQTQTTTAQEPSDLPETAPPQVVNVDEQGGQVTMKTQPAIHRPHPLETMGGPVELPRVWAFQADDRAPSVPGPVLRTTEGEDMEVTLDNTDGGRPHTIHFHGVSKQWEDDGVPTTTGIRVDPGEKHTYSIPANVPGTHIYHCHYQTQRHIEMGMFGIFRVDPEGYEPADREHFLTFKETDSRLSRQMAGEDVTYDPRNRRPDVFTVNGKCAPRSFHPEDGSPIIVEEGDTVRLHLANGGYMSHPMHIHNHRFRRVEKDGGQIPTAAQHEMDIVNMAPAERHTIEFEANADPGIYLMHCHKVNHVMNGNFYPGGMLAPIVYKDAMDTDIFSQLMEYAGYEA
jgi:FtsP/CotA-like multicopper oxidase with cupredoxin domain